MPELPETETIARDLDRMVSGARIRSAKVHRPDVLRGISAKRLERASSGALIERCWRRAKLVVLDLVPAARLIVQPRFTGALLVGTESEAADDPYAAVRFALEDGRVLRYRDVRRLGTVAWMSVPAFEAHSGRLGAEPLDREFTVERLSGLLRGQRLAIKKLLMDQRRIAGIGNIYANEALWRAGIDPSRRAGTLTEVEGARLHEGITGVLREAIAHRGTTFRDYRDPLGARGGFAERLNAYGRGSEPCPRCASRLIETHALDGRSTVFCAHCQR
jgi:formamidopyrimidine-DNA glycosylase